MTVDGDALDRLLERASAGDRDAFGRFYDLTAASAFTLARLVDPQRPEDLMREAYAAAWQALDQRGSHRPLPWLLAIVQQESRSGRRSPSPTG